MTIKTGDEVDAKHKCYPDGETLVLAHTVVAMVGDRIAKVKCNTCGKIHAYRPPDSPSEATAAKRRAERKKALAKVASRGEPEPFEILAAKVDLTQTTDYSIKMSMEEMMVVQHPKFGVGIVAMLREGNKADVVFNEGPRTLIYGRA